MEKICEGVTDLLKRPEDYLRPNGKLQEAWLEQTKAVYDFIKEEEGRHNLPAPDDALPQLYTDGLDAEQIWQLVELQNKPLLAAPNNIKKLDNRNLCFMVARLCSLFKYDKLTLEQSAKSEEFDAEGDEGIGGSSDEDEHSNMEAEDVKDLDMGGSGDEEEPGIDEATYEKDLFEEPKDSEETGLNCEFDDDSDNEEDNFDELIAPEGKESDEDEDNDNENVENHNAKKVETSHKFGKTVVDTKFFKLRESEWVADNDAIGKNYDLDSEDIDLMADVSDGSEEEAAAMYDAFFDVPRDEVVENKAKKQSESKKQSDLLDEDEMEDKEGEEEGSNEYESKSNVKDEKLDTSEYEEKGNFNQLLGVQKKEAKSTFEKEQEKALKVMATLEDANISEKPWYLRGEVVSVDRPENSALQEHMEYDIAVRQKPVITEDTTSLVEKIIMNRIRIKAWDDVERKVKPTLDPHEYKKKLLLDQEKSKKSLAEIYEEEYLKHQKELKEGEEELEEHKEIGKRMDSLFMKLDALANYHYTPRQTNADIKIKSNLPAIRMEEATPITATDASLLAPQEILEPLRGELRGKTECTSTDRKRERRQKKAHQKQKAKMQDKKLQEKLKKVGPNGRLDAKSSVKFIEKAVKTGQVKLLEGEQNKVIRSSHTFFKQLQDNSNNKIRKKKEGDSKKNKKGGNKSASKLML
ncbi:U3 small nucleolar ribonucleoprotein protein MPP10-like [Panulirus ornatus]|uniref:U3 small nucleolar ribonucleoprotein protein MPP10-like n=1 Tax=Panulirus ornatus TaxID=150431 RepID=UPI003A8A38E7